MDVCDAEPFLAMHRTNAAAAVAPHSFQALRGGFPSVMDDGTDDATKDAGKGTNGERSISQAQSVFPNLSCVFFCKNRSMNLS